MKYASIMTLRKHATILALKKPIWKNNIEILHKVMSGKLQKQQSEDYQRKVKNNIVLNCYTLDKYFSGV